MDKLKLAHDWYMKHADGRLRNLDAEVEQAWKYADAMQAEADSRVNKERPDVLKEWQPDWGQAPETAIEWFMIDNGRFNWKLLEDGKIWYTKAPSFNYQGNWQDSLRKRP